MKKSKVLLVFTMMIGLMAAMSMSRCGSGLSGKGHVANANAVKF